MALNSATLISAIKLRMKNELGYDLAQATKASPMDIMIEETIKHIQSFATVNSTVAVVSVGGVTTGPGVSGPGTGTAIGTIL
jgi:hypothetical protein